MILGIKIRLKPSKNQEIQLWKSVGTARFIYNWTIVRQEKSYQEGGRFISDSELRKEITKLKKTELGWLNQVSNNVAKQAVKDACNAYKRFFLGVSNRPRFKRKKNTNPSFYNDNVKLKVKTNMVLIEKVGWITTSEQIPFSHRYTNPRVSFDGKYWYLSVGIEHPVNKPQELTSEIIGIDVGIKDLAVCSNGMISKNINKTDTVKKLEKRLRRLQRSVSRKYKMNKEGSRYIKTSNIIKQEKDIRLLHRKLSNIRTNHLHQETIRIVKTKPSTIVMENLDLKGMMKNKHLSKFIAQQKLFEFKRQMRYKSEKYGIQFIEAGRWYPSSKTCSCCGHVKTKLSLSERTFKCEVCSLEIDRDYNAAINLSKYKLAV